MKHILRCFLAILFSITTMISAQAQTAYFSLAGNMQNSGDEVQVTFDLLSPVSAPNLLFQGDDLRFETHASGGGTNAAGQSIAAGGVDSLLRLEGGSIFSPTFHGDNDDIDRPGGDLDSLLSWPGVQTGDGTPLTPNPLQSGQYRLRHQTIGATQTGSWALDLIFGPAPVRSDPPVIPGDTKDFELAGFSAFGTSTVDSFLFGANSNGTAIYRQGSGSVQVQNLLSVAESGTAELILSGGVLVSGNTEIGRNGIGTLGTATISGTNTSWNNSQNLKVGGPPILLGIPIETSGVLNIREQGHVTTSTLAIEDSGIVNLDGGKLTFNNFQKSQAGTFNFLTGTLEATNGINIGGVAPFLDSVTLDSDRHLMTGSTTTINASRTLTLDGGSLETDDLVVNGSLDFRRGTLRIEGLGGLDVAAIGPLGASVTIGAGQNLEVSNTLAVDIGASLSLAPGGVVFADSLTNSGLVQGSGVVSAPLANQTAGQVRAPLGSQLQFTGPSHLNLGEIQLQGGRLDFGGTLTNDVTGNIVGRGTIDVGGAGLINQGDVAFSNGQTDVFGDVDNQGSGRVIISGGADVTFWDDVVDTGTLFNVSAGSSVTFFGSAGFGISGGGEVFFEADITPGSSPGLESFGGDVNFGVLSNLEIELAGLIQGSEYDALDIVGDATLGGTLEVTLLDGFEPTAGDTFEIVSANSIHDTFNIEDLHALSGGLQWFVDYQPQSVSLLVGLPGDFNSDGNVNGFDFLQWQRGESPNQGSAADLAAWQANYGTSASLAAVETVPEPATYFYCSLVALLVIVQRRQSFCD